MGFVLAKEQVTWRKPKATAVAELRDERRNLVRRIGESWLLFAIICIPILLAHGLILPDMLANLAKAMWVASLTVPFSFALMLSVKLFEVWSRPKYMLTELGISGRQFILFEGVSFYSLHPQLNPCRICFWSRLGEVRFRVPLPGDDQIKDLVIKRFNESMVCREVDDKEAQVPDIPYRIVMIGSLLCVMWATFVGYGLAGLLLKIAVKHPVFWVCVASLLPATVLYAALRNKMSGFRLFAYSVSAAFAPVFLLTMLMTAMYITASFV